MSKLIRVTVQADVNDGDYIHKIVDVTQEDFDRMDSVIHEIQQINKKHGSSYNYEKLIELRDTTLDSSLSELIEEFCDTYIPFFDNHDVHTIKSISSCNSPKNEWEHL